MNDLDRQVREAFDALKVPDGLNERTLDYIKERAAAAESAKAGAPSASSMPSAGKPHGQQEARPRGGQAELSPACRKKRRRRRLPELAVAACLLLAAVCAGGFGLLSQPSAYVSLDVNPSIELGVNRLGIVVSATGVNADGEEVLADLEREGVALAGRPFAQAASRLAESSALGSYVTNESFLQVSVVSEDAAQSAALQQESAECFSALPCDMACDSATSEERAAAQEAGMGIGRYRAACELTTLDPDTTLDECADMTMREIHDRIAECGGSNLAHEKGSGSGHGEPNGEKLARHRR